MIVDLFAGPGGWDLGARWAQLEDPVGLECGEAEVRTRAGAGLPTIRCDVANVTPADLFAGPIAGLIASPPCPAFSSAGKREGIADLPAIFQRIGDAGALGWHDSLRAGPIPPDGSDLFGEPRWHHPTSPLLLEPLRWASELDPEWIACEQVPSVLPAFRAMADTLTAWGYHAWSGRLVAADYGVPQVRVRAFLLASRCVVVDRPPATHSKGGSTGRRWVTMLEALGPDLSAVNTGRRWPKDGSGRAGAQTIQAAEPAPTLTGKSGGQWHLEECQAHGARRSLDQPAMTITAAADNGYFRWIAERPATTVLGDSRLWAPGHKENASDPPGKYQQRRGDQAMRLTVAQALALQSFPIDWPVAGTEHEVWRQVGNAVPPLLAAAVLRHVTEGVR